MTERLQQIIWTSSHPERVRRAIVVLGLRSQRAWSVVVVLGRAPGR
ncbi:hypothetical protein [Nocardia sp. NPDC059228]